MAEREADEADHQHDDVQRAPRLVVGKRSQQRIHTQQDAGNSNTTYQVSYALSGTNLQETDSRYGTNTIAANVSAFSVTRLTTTAPSTVTITITSGDVTRTFTVMCRNL